MRAVSSLVLLAIALILTGCRPLVTWSPDGRYVAVETDDRLRLFDTASHEFRTLARDPHKPISHAWSPDGTRLSYFLASVHGRKVVLHLVVLDVATGLGTTIVRNIPCSVQVGKWTPEPEPNVRDVSHIAWSPDGQRIAYAMEGSIWVVSPEGGASRPVTSGGWPGWAPAWSPNGRWIAYYSLRSEHRGREIEQRTALEVATADGRHVRRPWAPPHEREINLFSRPRPWWCATGERIGVFVMHYRKFSLTTEAWITPLEAGESRRMAVVPGEDPSFSPDLRTVLLKRQVGRGRVTRFEVLEPPYTRPRTLFNWYSRDGTTAEWVPALSADGRRVAVFIPSSRRTDRLLIGSLAGGRPQVFAFPRSRKSLQPESYSRATARSAASFTSTPRPAASGMR